MRLEGLFLNIVIEFMRSKTTGKGKRNAKGEENGPFLASGVPYLSLDGFVIDDERFGLKLDAYGGFWIGAELVSGEAREELGFADGGVTDQHDFEDVIDLVVEIAVQVRHPAEMRRWWLRETEGAVGDDVV